MNKLRHNRNKHLLAIADHESLDSGGHLLKISYWSCIGREEAIAHTLIVLFSVYSSSAILLPALSFFFSWWAQGQFPTKKKIYNLN